MTNLPPENLLSLSKWLHRETEQAADGLLQQTIQLINDFQVESTSQTLCSSATGDVYVVALQFPDSILHRAPLISEAFRFFSEIHLERSGLSTALSFFILGDTSYGECCVDEVAAAHLNADVVVHYGDACLSPTKSLPCLYVFPRCNFDRPDTTEAILKSAIEKTLQRENTERLVILYDSDLSSCICEDTFVVNDRLITLRHPEKKKGISIASLRLNNPNSYLKPGNYEDMGEDFEQIGALRYAKNNVPIQLTTFLWLTSQPTHEGWPSAVRNAALKLSTGPEPRCAGFFGVCLTENPSAGPVLVDASRIIRKRYGVLSKAKHAERIGIVPGTLGISGNMSIIERCQNIVSRAEKRSYMILVGKPNPSKLANFQEIDVFVLVACPQNALLVGRDYLQPILTPMELEAALLDDGDIFSEPYSVDFRDLLRREPILKPQEIARQQDGLNESSLVTRGNWSVSVTGNGAGADYLNSRQWKGLSYSSGGPDDEVDVSHLSTDVKQGQSGIASKYEREIPLIPSNK
eukprot:GFKZ01004712.1.p1 GENE.GFKZ01004712.1~~GFKZ01004712.1.p1  ORF type:complete len:521 (+),score=51.06 GFKZ01004712.1:90-1652(+)